MTHNLFQNFKTDISSYEIPHSFTYPFNYVPHALAKVASEELQVHLEEHPEFFKNLGSNGLASESNVGKMFGVLVVQSPSNELGYLCGFSGKLSDSSEAPLFVPPVVNILADGGIFNKEDNEITAISGELNSLEDSNQLALLEEKLLQSKKQFELDLKNKKSAMDLAKEHRAHDRQRGLDNLEDDALKVLTCELNLQSKTQRIELAEFKKNENLKLKQLEDEIQSFKNRVMELKILRKQKSNILQQNIFNKFSFLNFYKKSKTLSDCFKNENNPTPPSGSGDCAAPKLLEYAYKNHLKPIALAEFWWGPSPKSEIRQHKNYYPACKSKCQPILHHMLEGLDVEANPLLERNDLEIKTIYEDDHIIVIDKPTGLLSAPGKSIEDSVYSRLKKSNPKITGPIVVHRLDMATSGIILCAKNVDVYKKLQAQFINRTIKKRYVALLEGVLSEKSGSIELPLIVDWENRPKQKVCYEMGKTAKTEWRLIDRVDNKSRVYFYPITGRTHQLRIHAAHHEGLNRPIVGDKFYGKSGERLHLHAEQISFRHPVFEVEMMLSSLSPF